jgi:hypothetical protein
MGRTINSIAGLRGTRLKSDDAKRIWNKAKDDKKIFNWMSRTWNLQLLSADEEYTIFLYHNTGPMDKRRFFAYSSEDDMDLIEYVIGKFQLEVFEIELKKKILRNKIRYVIN